MLRLSTLHKRSITFCREKALAATEGEQDTFDRSTAVADEAVKSLAAGDERETRSRMELALENRFVTAYALIFLTMFERCLQAHLTIFVCLFSLLGWWRKRAFLFMSLFLAGKRH